MNLLEEFDRATKPFEEHFASTERAKDDTLLTLVSHDGDISLNICGNGVNLVESVASALNHHDGFRSVMKAAMSLYMGEKRKASEAHKIAETNKHRKINS